MASPPGRAKRASPRIDERHMTSPTPPACSTAPERPKIDVSLAQHGPWSPGRQVPRKVAQRWQYFQGRFPSPLGYTKMAFRRLWHAVEVPHAPSSATQSRGRPSARASTKCLRGVGWLPPRHDSARPLVPTRRARVERAGRVRVDLGITLAPRTAHPRVG
jgi:hypothetical protein